MKLFYNYIRIQQLLQKICTAITFILVASPSLLSQSFIEKEKGEGFPPYMEELSVQTDRDVYIAGERVLFKIYKLNGLTRTPGNVSKVVYVDLLDNFNNPVVQVKAGLRGPSGSGTFILPDTLRTGNYLIRSCTSWMKNFSSDLFSYRRISVINPFQDFEKVRLALPEDKPDSIVFYPECGKIIAGLTNVVGYRCFTKEGTPCRVNGLITDSGGDTLGITKADNTGSGFFSVTPSDSRRLFFVTEDGNHKTKKYSLPSIQDSGVAFSVSDSPVKDMLKVKVHGSGNMAKTNVKMFLVYSPASSLSYRKEIDFENNKEIFLRKDTLPSGLAMISLTDLNGTILSKRWICNEKKEDIKFDIKLRNSDLSTRDKVTIDISAFDDKGRPVKSDLTISVVKSFAVDKTNSSNMPGTIQFPFLSAIKTDLTQFGINDYLLFYSSDDDLSNPVRGGSDYLPEFENHVVSGCIKSLSTGEPLKNQSVILSFVGKTARCRFSKTDEKGNFNFVTDEHGVREIVIQPLSPELTGYYVELNNPFPEPFIRYKPVTFSPDSSKLTEINNAVISMQVKNIYGQYHKEEKIIEDESNDGNNFYGDPDETAVVSKYIELLSIKEAIKEIVPGVSIHKRDGKSGFRLVNKSMDPAFENEPLVLFDGVLIKDIDKMLLSSPREVEKIEVLNTRYFISDIFFDGIINFTTTKGDLSAFEFDKTIFRQEFEALQPPFTFGTPDYSVDSVKSSRLPDFRNTLYWNPDMSSDDKGRAEAEFYTSDETGQYTIIVEGISSDGSTGRSEMSFIVKGDKGN